MSGRFAFIESKTAAIDGYSCRVRIPQDPGAGRFVSHQLAKKLIGYEAIVEPNHAPKMQRAAPFAAAGDNRLVVLAEAPWNHDFIEDLCAFPNGRNDDQVDAVCAAFRAFVRRPTWAFVGAQMKEQPLGSAAMPSIKSVNQLTRR